MRHPQAVAQDQAQWAQPIGGGSWRHLREVRNDDAVLGRGGRREQQENRDRVANPKKHKKRGEETQEFASVESQLRFALPRFCWWRVHGLCVHAALRSRAAKAPSNPCLWGSTRS